MYKLIEDILRNPKIVNKQLLIENTLVEYEINYFADVAMKSEYSVDMKVLHKYFKKWNIKSKLIQTFTHLVITKI